MNTIVRYITDRLRDVYEPDEAQALAWWVAEEVTGQTRSQLLSDCKSTTNIPNTQIFDAIIDRLRCFEPIQYIFGHTLWCGLDLKVTPATLIPRPETAELVEAIIHHTPYTIHHTPTRVLDIGTGSGCIALALKQAHPEWQVTGIDISAQAIEVAKENALRNHLDVDFQVADIFQSPITNNLSPITDKHYDLVVSNPPYICEKEKTAMRPNVLNYEPASALFVPDNDPLKFYRRIAELFSLPSRERSGVGLFFEINEAYPKELVTLLEDLGYTDIQITQDTYGKPRIIEARSAR